MTERGAQKVVRRLEAIGLVEIAVQGNRGVSNRYRILLDQRVKPVQVIDADTLNQSARHPEPRSGEPLAHIRLIARRLARYCYA